MSILETKHLLNTVTGDLRIEIPVHELEQALEVIKTRGRLPEVSQTLSENDISALIKCYLRRPVSATCTIEASTIIANALLLNKDLLQNYDTKELTSCITKEYQRSASDNPKDAFLFLRVLFLCTITGKSIENSCLKTCVSIVQSKIAEVTEHPMYTLLVKDPAFIECLKLAFNLLHHYPEIALPTLQASSCERLVRSLISCNATDESYQQFYQQVINYILCIPVDKWLYHTVPPSELITSICEYLRTSILMFCPVDDDSANLGDLSLTLTTAQEHTLSPQLSLFHATVTEIFNSSPENKELQLVVNNYVLPSVQDRQKPLGKSSSLSGCLIRVASNPLVKNSRNIIYDVLWKVCGEDHDVFVQSFGLGFASSFLASQGIAFPGSLTTDSGSQPSSRKNSAVSTDGVNFITGQLVSHEEQPVKRPLEELTEEEKLRDAERLFVLFERLKANKVLSVENPVAVAAREGRLQEVE